MILIVKLPPDSCSFPAVTIEESPLQILQIHFGTDTFDEIEKDVKMTLEGQLGLVGGTLGLLTGFSVLSGVEIIYYVAKFFMSLWISKIQRRKKKRLAD